MILWGWPLVRSCTVNADQWWGYEQEKGSENSPCSLLNMWLSQSYFSPLSLNMRRVRSQCFPPKMNQTAGVKATWETKIQHVSESLCGFFLLQVKWSWMWAEEREARTKQRPGNANWITLLNHLISRSLRSLLLLRLISVWAEGSIGLQVDAGVKSVWVFRVESYVGVRKPWEASLWLRNTSGSSSWVASRKKNNVWNFGEIMFCRFPFFHLRKTDFCLKCRF